MNLFQFLLEIGANFRLDWNYGKKRWRVSIPGASYVLAATASMNADGTVVTVNYFSTTFLPFIVHRAVAVDAVKDFVTKIRGAKMRRKDKTYLVPLDLAVPPLSSFPVLVKPETCKSMDIFYESPGLGMAHVETLGTVGSVVTPDYPEPATNDQILKEMAALSDPLDMEAESVSIPFPFKKQFPKHVQPQPPEPKPQPEPKPKTEPVDPFF